jgi:hypothetical protein
MRFSASRMLLRTASRRAELWLWLERCNGETRRVAGRQGRCGEGRRETTAARCRAVPCRAVPCRAVPCLALPCVRRPCSGTLVACLRSGGAAHERHRCLILRPRSIPPPPSSPPPPHTHPTRHCTPRLFTHVLRAPPCRPKPKTRRRASVCPRSQRSQRRRARARRRKTGLRRRLPRRKRQVSALVELGAALESRSATAEASAWL